MFAQKLIERSKYMPYLSARRKSEEEIKYYSLYEWNLAAFGLVLSIIIIASKVYFINREFLYRFIFEEQLVTYEIVTSNGDIMFKYAWKTVIRYSRVWLPALCGFLGTYFTWLFVYLDSSVPGVQPPSPFSPSKYRAQSGHTFHSNYIFAVVMGLLISSYMYWKGISVEF